jgi:hypothetical protein
MYLYIPNVNSDRVRYIAQLREDVNKGLLDLIRSGKGNMCLDLAGFRHEIVPLPSEHPCDVVVHT